MKLRTILNIDIVGMSEGGSAHVEEVRPSTGLFRMGEAVRGEGEWERWGWAAILAAFLHVGAVFAAVSIPRAVPKAPVRPEEPELVLLAYSAPRAAAPRAPQAAETQPRIPPKQRVRPQRPLVAPQVPKPLPEKAPEPQEAVKDTPPETPAPEEESDVATGSEVVGGVVAGLVGSAMSTPGGSELGVSGGEAVDLKQVSRPPRVLEQVQPQYPRMARSRGIEGLVLVRVIIGIDGRVEPEHTRVMRSVPALDEAAVSAVSRWRFTPALGRSGRPVRVIIEVPVQFSLK